MPRGARGRGGRAEAAALSEEIPLPPASPLSPAFCRALSLPGSGTRPIWQTPALAGDVWAPRRRTGPAPASEAVRLLQVWALCPPVPGVWCAVEDAVHCPCLSTLGP